MDRRMFLRAFGAAACSAAAHPLLSTVTLAKGAPALGENRLVVIILRGAMDGLDVVQPRGEPEFATLRPGLATTPGLALDGFWQMHGALEGLLPLWQAGELGFVHAVSTPYRDKRSHFDGQDMLEAGTGADVPLGAVRDGWLNRMLQAVPGVSAETAYAVGPDELRVLSGAAEVRNWAPDQDLALSAQGRLLLEHVAHDDDLFRAAVAEALELTAEAPGLMAGGEAGKADDVTPLVDFVAGRLRGETRIAAFSLTGWDTHKAQANLLRRPLGRLQAAILRLKAQLGPPVWGRTAVLAMTEFGRTARENGSGGTDHGTGGLMVAAGGAVKGGQVLGQWPGLSDGALFEGRDLMPTTDVRAWAAHAMAGLYGLDRAVLEASVFPGLRAEGAAGLIL